MPKKSAKPTASVFARALAGLLDQTGFYTRAQWSQFLGISEAAISQWVNDRTVPRADLLRMIIDILGTRGGVGAGEALHAFEGVMDAPAADISPIGARFAPDLRSYLAARQSLADLARSLRDLPEAEQIAALRDGGIGDAVAAAPPLVAPHLPSVVQDAASSRAPRLPRLLGEAGTGGEQRAVTLERFAREPRAVIVGMPGSGKSRLLDYLEATPTLRGACRRTSLRGQTADDFAGWLAVQLAEPDAPSLIVDGFDEMDLAYREGAIAALNRAVQGAPRTHMLVASRPVAGLDRLEGFESFAIAPLSDVDLIAEVTGSRLANANPVEVERFFCHLSERDALRLALRNPLFLHTAWTLFEQNAVTPFSEGAVVRECARMLVDWDHAKGFSRVRAPWASTHVMFALLGEISLNMLKSSSDGFSAEDFGGWVRASAWKAPVDRLLDLFMVQGLLVEEKEHYCFSYKVLRDYFAARYVIESAGSAAKYFGGIKGKPKMGGAVRLACSLASDSTELIEAMIAGGPDKTDHMLLADILAQPIVAQRETLDSGCREIVSWLDEQTEGWEVVDDSTVDDGEQPAHWAICARVGKPSRMQAISGTLQAVHRARSGPACSPLRIELGKARSTFLHSFSQAMEVEGRLRIGFGSEDAPRGAARVAVESLHLT